MTVVNVRLRVGATVPTTVILRRITAISGVTKDSTGAVLPFCAVHLFRTVGDLEMATGVSDANGVYTFPIYDTMAYYVVATRYAEYRFDSTAYTFDADTVTFDVSQVDGATQNTLLGT